MHTKSAILSVLLLVSTLSYTCGHSFFKPAESSSVQAARASEYYKRADEEKLERLLVKATRLLQQGTTVVSSRTKGHIARLYELYAMNEQTKCIA